MDGLVETGIAAKGCKGQRVVFFVGFVENGGANSLEVELQFFGEDVLDQRFDSDIVVPADCRQSVGSLFLCCQFLISLICLREISWDPRLDTRHRLPMHREAGFPRDFRERGVDELLKVDFFIYHIEQRLSRSY